MFPLVLQFVIRYPQRKDFVLSFHDAGSWNSGGIRYRLALHLITSFKQDVLTGTGVSPRPSDSSYHGPEHGSEDTMSSPTFSFRRA